MRNLVCLFISDKMETVKNTTPWYLIFEDGNGEYHILNPGGEKEMHDPQLVESGTTPETVMRTLRTLMGETVHCISPNGEPYIWETIRSIHPRKM